MHISYEGTYENGHRLGDSIAYAYAARVIAASEVRTPRVSMTFNRDHPYNFVFDQFCADYGVERHYTQAIPTQSPYGRFNEIRRDRTFHGKHIGAYKELYRRIDGELRQTMLCGEHRALEEPHGNIFTYLLRGQESAPSTTQAINFGPQAFGWEWKPEAKKKSVYVSPHEMSQGNAYFTLEFWQKVVALLLKKGVTVTVASDQPDLWPQHKNLALFYAQTPQQLVATIAAQRLVICGNTGTGWVAGATGTPLIVCEPPHLNFEGWRFARCGFRNIVATITSDDAQEAAGAVLTQLPKQ